MVEVIQAPEDPKRVGPPPVFDPTREQWDKISGWWHDLRYSPSYALKRASEVMGFEVTRNHLNHNMGPRKMKRWDRRPPVNKPS